MTNYLSPALRDALMLYAELEHAVVMAGRSVDPARKLELVQSRRRFAEQLGRVGILLEQDETLAGHPDKQQAMIRLFSAFRYALGQHQANWPAVRIDEDRDGYMASAQNAYAKSDALWDWCAANINFRRAMPVRAPRAAA